MMASAFEGQCMLALSSDGRGAFCSPEAISVSSASSTASPF
jgi:hypothetical protein